MRTWTHAVEEDKGNYCLKGFKEMFELVADQPSKTNFEIAIVFDPQLYE